MKYIILEPDLFESVESHAYDFTVTKKDDGALVYKLKYSRDPIWTDYLRGQDCMEAVDDGSGFKFSSLNEEMDYSSFAELNLLLKCIELYEQEYAIKSFPEYKVMKVNEPLRSEVKSSELSSTWKSKLLSPQDR